jgi:DNA-binding CsgD family transcriptional regulator
VLSVETTQEATMPLPATSSERDVDAPDALDVPDGDATCHVRVAAVLAAMLQQARDGVLTLAPCVEGVAGCLELDDVRCVVVVRESRPRQTLSPREFQVARLVADGATNRVIAAVLDISLWTVSTHVRRIFTKLDVSCRAEMVAKVFGVTGASGQSEAGVRTVAPVGRDHTDEPTRK